MTTEANYRAGHHAGRSFASSFRVTYQLRNDVRLDVKRFVENCEALFSFERFADKHFRRGLRDGVLEYAADVYKK